jgi:hypothetical protein
MTLSRVSVGLALVIGVSSCGGSMASNDGGVEDDAATGADTAAHDAAGADAVWCAEKAREATLLLLAAEMSGGKDLSCQTDDDCRIVWRATQCSDNCSTLTTRTIEEKIKAAIAEANATVCVEFRAAGCKLILPPCAPPSPPVCAMGMCSAKPS